MNMSNVSFVDFAGWFRLPNDSRKKSERAVATNTTSDKACIECVVVVAPVYFIQTFSEFIVHFSWDL